MTEIQLDGLNLTGLKQMQKSVAKAIDGYTDRKKREPAATDVVPLGAMVVIAAVGALFTIVKGMRGEAAAA